MPHLCAYWVEKGMEENTPIKLTPHVKNIEEWLEIEEWSLVLLLYSFKELQIIILSGIILMLEQGEEIKDFLKSSLLLEVLKWNTNVHLWFCFIFSYVSQLLCFKQRHTFKNIEFLLIWQQINCSGDILYYRYRHIWAGSMFKLKCSMKAAFGHLGWLHKVLSQVK